MKKITYYLLAALTFSLVGCATNAPVAKKTSLEIQAIQARNFDADRTTTFRSVLSVLQDLGYIVGSASLETGFITAESATQADTGGAAFVNALFGVRGEGKTAVTASVEEFGKSTRVRLNFLSKRTTSGSYGYRANDETPIENPDIYNNAFDKIGEAIFIRNAQK